MAIRGKLAGDDDVITYAVVDSEDNVLAEYFDQQDADDYLMDSIDNPDRRYVDGDLRIVELCNGIELE